MDKDGPDLRHPLIASVNRSGSPNNDKFDSPVRMRALLALDMRLCMQKADNLICTKRCYVLFQREQRINYG